MENNKLMKVREGIFSKIFKKIKLLFFKNSPKEETKEEKQEIIKSNFKEEIKCHTLKQVVVQRISTTTRANASA